jgi:hypothetical protein
MGQLISTTRAVEIDPYNTLRILESQISQHENEMRHLMDNYRQTTDYAMLARLEEPILATERLLVRLRQQLARCQSTIAQHGQNFTFRVQVDEPSAPTTDAS